MRPPTAASTSADRPRRLKPSGVLKAATTRASHDTVVGDSSIEMICRGMAPPRAAFLTYTVRFAVRPRRSRAVLRSGRARPARRLRKSAPDNRGGFSVISWFSRLALLAHDRLLPPVPGRGVASLAVARGRPGPARHAAFYGDGLQAADAPDRTAGRARRTLGSHAQVLVRLGRGGACGQNACPAAPQADVHHSPACGAAHNDRGRRLGR